jgi:hypothetical protein
MAAQRTFNATIRAATRGTIIERLARFEALIDILIRGYYFPNAKPTREFQDDILYDEGFSFGLRRSVLEKILRRERLYEEDRMHDIRKMNRLRNVAAHTRAGRFEGLAAKHSSEFREAAARAEKYLSTVMMRLRIPVHVDPLPARVDLLNQEDD